MMQTHWTEVAPPAYITQAAEVGYRGTSAPSESEEADMIEDPDQLALALGSIPGGSIIG